MRLSTPFQGAGVILMLIATMFALMGHFNGDHKTLVACGLYILGGLSLGGGLVIFASVLSDAYMDRPRRQTVITGSPSYATTNMANLFDYRYGWSFFAAGAAFIMAEVAALLSMTAYLRRFPTVEDMVRVMVPGAERHLRQQQGSAEEYLVHNRRQNGPPSLWSGSKSDGLGGSDMEGVEGPLLLSNTAPDICTTNTTSVVMDPDGCSTTAPPTSVLVTMSDTVTTTSTQPPPAVTLAGITVPITLMRGSQQHLAVKPTAAVPDPMPTPFLFAQQLQRLGVTSGTLVHQGMLGVSEGGASTSSNSSGSCHSSSSVGKYATLPVKKKSVTISTFSTMDTWSNSEV